MKKPIISMLFAAVAFMGPPGSALYNLVGPSGEVLSRYQPLIICQKRMVSLGMDKFKCVPVLRPNEN